MVLGTPHTTFISTFGTSELSKGYWHTKAKSAIYQNPVSPKAAHAKMKSAEWKNLSLAASVIENIQDSNCVFEQMLFPLKHHWGFIHDATSHWVKELNTVILRAVDGQGNITKVPYNFHQWKMPI